MGMPIVVDVCDADVDASAVDHVFEWLRFVDRTFSTYREDSDISRLARGECALADCHRAVAVVLKRCDALRLETGGYFDARAAGTLDPSGLVKGWSVDGAARLLERHGARNYSVNAGGDIRVCGCPLPGERWRIGIQHPTDATAVAAVVASNDLAIATSGAYERGDHVIDPHSGRSPRDVLSVTIVGPDLATADAYATAAFAMDGNGPAWTATLRDYGAMTILADETVLTTPGFQRVRL